MNSQAIIGIIEYLDHLPEDKFSMRDQNKCLRGHMEQIFGLPFREQEGNIEMSLYLDIPEDHVIQMVFPRGRNTYSCTSKDAAKMLTNYLLTETVVF